MHATRRSLGVVGSGVCCSSTAPSLAMPASLSYAAVPAYSVAEEERAAQELADADSGDDLLVDLACSCCCAVARRSKDSEPRKCFSCINFLIVFAACVFCLVVGAVVYSVDLLSHLLALCSNLRIALITVPVVAGFLWILGTALLWRSYRHRSEAHQRTYAKASLTQELLPRGINDDHGSCSSGGPPRRCTCKRCARCTISLSFWSLFAILNLAILALFSLLLFMQIHTLPKLSGSIRMGSGMLAATASISRTTEGILHIESHDESSAARSEYDLFFAQGVAHAQDRLWQMEFQRAVGQGRLGELTGYNEAVVDIDRLSRTMGFYLAAEAAIPNLTPRSQEIIRAYCDGVNQYLASDSLALSIEFYVLGLSKPDWWVPADVLVWTKIVSYMLSGNLDNELQRWDLAMLLPEPLDWSRIATLLPAFDYTRFPFILEGEIPESDMRGYNHALNPKEEPMMAWRRSEEGQAFLARLAKAREEGRDHPRLSGPGSAFHSFRHMFGPSTASNDWVVGGNRTKSQMPLLSNDPHLQLMAPSIWILNHLESPSFTASGASFVGTPGVILGHNGNISWGVTNVGLDCQDLFIMHGNYTHYLHNGIWREYKVRNEVIRIKGHHADIPLQIRSSLYGPVISDLGFDSINDADLSIGPALSLRWTSLDANDTTFDAFLNINSAENFDQWQTALERFVAPAQNMIFADAEGNIGYQTTGRAPIRANNGTGLSPVPGSGEFDWLLHESDGSTQFVPFSDMPRMRNPNKSYVATANNAVVPPGYKVYLTGDWDSGSDGYRAKRITEMITGEAWMPTELALKSVGASTAAASAKPPHPPSNNGPKHSVSSMVAIQQNYLSGAALDFQQFVLPLLSPTSGQGPQSSAGQALLASWVDWDAVMSIGTQEGAMWQRWYLRLQKLAGKETNNTYWSVAPRSSLPVSAAGVGSLVCASVARSLTVRLCFSSCVQGRLSISAACLLQSDHERH